MIKLIEPADWRLDDNGVSLISQDGSQIIDLHSEAHVAGVKVEGLRLVLKMLRTTDHHQSKAKSLGPEFSLVISGVRDARLPDFEYPEIFEGIYDFDGESLSLCVGSSKCYAIKGDNLGLHVIK